MRGLLIPRFIQILPYLNSVNVCTRVPMAFGMYSAPDIFRELSTKADAYYKALYSSEFTLNIHSCSTPKSISGVYV